MKQKYTIFTDQKAFCDFINSLSKYGRKFNVTPWNSSDGSETGFVVWHY